MVCNREIYEGECYYDFCGFVICDDENCLDEYIREHIIK